VALTAFALFGVIFENLFAAGAVAGGAVAIPIIIHLLNRKRFRVVTWAAMRFLLAAQKKNSRRMRLEQLILLAVRCAMVLLLVLAMASVTPWAEAVWHWANPDGGLTTVAGGPRTHKILVVDGSFSMGLKKGEGTCFEQARALAAQIVRESAGGDGFSVVLMGAPRPVVPEPSEDARKVVAEIEAMRLTHGSADLRATLNTVARLVGASPGKYPQREIYFLTDLQKSLWKPDNPSGLSDVLKNIQARARTIFVDVGRDGAENLAVTNLALGDSMAITERETPILATLHNFGPTRTDVSVRLYVGRARAGAAERPAELHEVGEVLVRQVAAAQSTPVAFKYKFPTPGDYVLQVQVRHDALEIDDLRSAVVTVKDTIPVLLVNGKPAVELYDRATEWLKTALNPFDDGPTPATVAARPKVMSQSQFADEGLGDLTPYDCVYLCDVPRFSLAEVRRLEAHVRRGGSVVFCLGEQVDEGSYNEMLYRDGKGLLPGRLMGKQQAPADYSYSFSLDKANFNEAPLRAFPSAAAQQRLKECRFRKFIQVDQAPRAGPRTVLTFTAQANREGVNPTNKPPDGPAVLEWRPPIVHEPAPGGEDKPAEPAGRMRGRVVLVTTTVNSDWNHWPASPSFPPLMQELLNFAASARLCEQALEVGEPVDLYLPNTAAGIEATVRTPDGRTETVRTQAQDDAAVLRWTDTDVSGVYAVTLGQDPREYLFAVNVPALSESTSVKESDLTRTNREELERTYPEWQQLQVVTDPHNASHTPLADGAPEVVVRPLGPVVARWLMLALLLLVLLEVVLAWQFGHFSSAVQSEPAARARSRAAWAFAAVPTVLFLCGLGLAAILVHDTWTGDFLGFLPESMRRGVERVLNIPPPAPGEGSRWRLEFSSYFWDGHSDLWLAGTLAAAALAGVGWITFREGRRAVPSRGDGLGRVVRVGLRMGLLFVMLAVLLPQLKLWFERQGWPDVVLLLDDSASMSTTDRYRDPQVQEVADRLARHEGLTKGERLDLAQALVTRSEPDWLTALLTQRQVRVHVYHLSDLTRRVDVTSYADIRKGLAKVNALQAEAKHNSSQLGAAVRQVLNHFRGSSLAAVVMLTDGVTTEGEDLPKVAKYAKQMGVPLFFVGLGDSHEVRDIYLHDLQVEESVYVNDTVVFELRLTAQGYDRLNTEVVLREKGDPRILDRKPVSFDGKTRTVKVRLTHKPTTPGEKVYEVEVPAQDDEADKDNNRLERQVFVMEARQIKVLYVEGYRRYEYHYVKTLLERESSRIKGNKSVDIRVLLLDADPEFAEQDRYALAEFPTRAELFGYDVVILGDVDPQSRADPKMPEHLKDLADFVRERGGGLLVVAGERFTPQAYKDTPLKDVLPIDVLTDKEAEARAAEPIAEGYRPELTPVGRMHPVFRFDPDERVSEETWNRLREMYWYADSYQVKRAAEVLAVHPKVRRAGAGEDKAGGGRPDRHPLVVQHFVGAGRALFFGFDETWRWGFREDQLHFNQFWVQAIRYLARSKVGRVELRLDRATPYRRGEPIKILVRFPDDAPPPPADTEVKVVVERRNPARPGDTEVRTVQLSQLKGSRASFEALLTQTPEGEYKFWLSQPAVSGPKPRAEARVLTPPGEMEQLRMNQADLERAAEESQGKFYGLVEAKNLVKELPVGTRVTVNAPGPPYLIWNHFAVFLLALAFLTAEWIMRKQSNLL
jgi:hypothetical protein